MVMEINIIPEVKLKTEAMVRDVTARGSHDFDTRAGDIKLLSA